MERIERIDTDFLCAPAATHLGIGHKFSQIEPQLQRLVVKINTCFGFGFAKS